MSSEFHAWGDSNLYLRRNDNELILTVEHRAAPSLPSIPLELVQRGDALALEPRATLAAVTTEQPVTAVPADQRILDAFGSCDGPVSPRELRERCALRKATFYGQLTELIRLGRIVRSPEGLRLAPRPRPE
jgi:hypothetical protein